MTSESAMKKWIEDHLGPEVAKVHKIQEIFEPFINTIRTFRAGAYLSVDEFGQLANGGMQREVQELKRLMSYVLALVHLDHSYTSSAYYSLANALFKPDTAELRDDISILTLNYDPHLEYIVNKAHVERRRVSSIIGRLTSMSSILSGFASEMVPWEDETAFCILKLHGTIGIRTPSIPCNKMLTFDDLVRPFEPGRSVEILSKTIKGGLTPVVFPWELMDENGSIRPESNCAWNCDIPGVGPLRDVMSKIWKRAAREIEMASSISFVGLSMHHYLEPGFKHLFRNKRGKIKLTIANPDIRDMDPEAFKRGEYHPRCSLRRIRNFIHKAAPELEISKAPVYLGFEEFIAGEVAL